MKINLLTYNIQHGLDYQLIKYDQIRHINLDNIAKVIIDSNADIIGLNEVYNSSIKNPDRVEQAKKLARYTNIKNHIFAKALSVGGADDYGNACLSKIDYLDYEIFSVPSPEIKREKTYYEDRCILKVNFKLDNDKILTCFITHFGIAKAEQESMYNRLKEETAKINNPFVIMGDFNLEDDSPYIDDFKKIFNIAIKDPTPTFTSLNPYKRIDYIFTSKDIKIIEAKVLNFIASDHLPVFATIEV